MKRMGGVTGNKLSSCENQPSTVIPFVFMFKLGATVPLYETLLFATRLTIPSVVLFVLKDYLVIHSKNSDMMFQKYLTLTFLKI